MTVNAGRAALLLAGVSLAFGAWQLAAPSVREGRDGAAAAVTGAVARADEVRLSVAAANLELARRTTGTYAGAALPAGLVLVRSGADGYCVELADGGRVAHLPGPGAPAAAGPC